MFEQNPLYHGPFPAPTPDAPSEEDIPDHCRPLSPERDGLDNSSGHSSPGVPEMSAEGQTEGGDPRESCAVSDRGAEASGTPAVLNNSQSDHEQQYTSETSDI